MGEGVQGGVPPCRNENESKAPRAGGGRRRLLDPILCIGLRLFRPPPKAPLSQHTDTNACTNTIRKRASLTEGCKSSF